MWIRKWKHRYDRLLEQIKRWLTDPIVSQISGQALLLVLGVILSLPQLELLTREPHMLRLPLQREADRKTKTLTSKIQLSICSVFCHCTYIWEYVFDLLVNNVLLHLQNYFEASDYCHSMKKYRWIVCFSTFKYSPTYRFLAFLPFFCIEHRSFSCTAYRWPWVDRRHRWSHMSTVKMRRERKRCTRCKHEDNSHHAPLFRSL